MTELRIVELVIVDDFAVVIEDLVVVVVCFVVFAGEALARETIKRRK